MSFNKIIIVGNIGRDPELRFTPTGTEVTDFSVATTEKSRGGKEQADEKTTWFKVTAWRNTAKVCAEYLKKGDRVYLEGTLTVEEWTDKEGEKQFTLRVNATDVQFLTQKDRTGKEQPETKAEPTEGKKDIPF